MKKAIIISAILVWGLHLIGQNTIDDVLSQVEKNNTTLSAFRKSIDAEKIGNKTGLTPQNPEIEFNYLWGSPSAIGNRTDFRIMQSFDFPTAYSYKSKISDLKNDQAELEYKKQRMEVFYQTRIVCAKLMYYNALKLEWEKRLANAQEIADAYKTQYNVGDEGILEFNKSQITLLNVSKELENIEIEQNALFSELATLNGGNPIHFTDSLISMQTVPADFEDWFALVEANNPLLQWIKKEMAISSIEIKLNTALNLPKFHAGYMSEKVVGEKFQGVTSGMTIPLWENKSKVKYAKAKTMAMQSVETDAKLQFFNDMKAMHAKVTALQNTVTDYRNKLALYSNNELLEKAFHTGEISLTEYRYELSVYYDSMNKLLDLELSLHLALTELYRYQ